MQIQGLVGDIETFPSRDAAARAAASSIVTALSRGIVHRGFASFAASGGKTPRDTYRILAKTSFEWGRVAVTLTDDTLAPPLSPESRAAVVGRYLLSKETRAVRFFPLWSASANSATAAFAANEALRPLAPFDATLLGMDENGCVAQLCGQETLPQAAMEPHGRRLVVSTGVSGLTLTLSALANSRHLVLLILGPTKLQALSTAHERNLPVAHLMRHARPRIFWAA